MATVGEKIKEARLKQGMTQLELAKKINSDQSEISRIETNRRKVKDTMKPLLASVLDEDLVNLFFT